MEFRRNRKSSASLHFVSFLFGSAMSSIRNDWIGLLFLVFLFPAPFASAADISPYLNSQTIGVVRIDLKQLKIQEYIDYYKGEINRAIAEIVPKEDGANAAKIKQELEEQWTEQSAPAQIEMLRQEVVEKGKAEEVFAIFYKDAIFDQQFPVLIAIPVPPSASQKQIDTIRMQYLKNSVPVTFVRHGFIVGIPILKGTDFATQQEVMDYARAKFESPSSEARPEFAEAFSKQPEVLIQLVIGRIAPFQREVEQFLDAMVNPALLMAMPKEDREKYQQMRKNIPLYFQGLNYYSFSYDYSKSEIRSIVQCVDEGTAKRIYDMEMSRIDKHAEDVTKNLPSSKRSSELQESLNNFVKAVDTKLVKNDILTVIDSSGMQFIKTLFYEAMIKSNVQASYMTETGQEETGVGTEIEEERQITPEMIEKFEQLMQEPLRNVSPELRPQAEQKVKDKVREMQQQMERQQRKRNESR